MTDLATRLKPENLFPGEFEAIESEFCGLSPVGLLRLPHAKRERLLAWLRFSQADRENALRWATDEGKGYPVAAALHRLQNPARYRPTARAATKSDTTIAAISAWLEEGDE